MEIESLCWLLPPDQRSVSVVSSDEEVVLVGILTARRVLLASFRFGDVIILIVTSQFAIKSVRTHVI